MLETHLLNSIVALIRQRIGDTEAIYLFGSYSRSEECDESDIDLALIVCVVSTKNMLATLTI